MLDRTTPDDPVYCNLCEPPYQTSLAMLGRHLTDVHGISFEEKLDHWPDGSPVVVDETLEASDFEHGKQP